MKVESLGKSGIVAALVCALGCVSLILPGGTAAARNDACESVAPRSLPDYSIAGLWGAKDHQTLVLVEPTERKLSLFTEGRRPALPPPATLASSMDYLQPIGATALSDGGMVIEVEGGRFWQLGSDMRSAAGPYELATYAGVERVVPYRWDLIGDGLEDGHLVMCGDVLRDGEWTSGIFHLPTGPESASKKITELHRFDDLRDLNRLGCRLGTQIFGVIDGEAYVLLLSGIDAGDEGQPQIYRLDVGGERLEKLALSHQPEEMLTSPALATFSPASHFEALMRNIELSTMPTEMVSWDGWLFVLLRQPEHERGNGSARTRYSVARIAPSKGDEGAAVVVAPLKSNANHVSLIAGPDKFALVEKLAAKAIGEHRVRSLRLIPSSQFEAMADDKPLCH